MLQRSSTTRLDIELRFDHLEPAAASEAMMKVLHVRRPSIFVYAVRQEARINKVVFVPCEFVLIAAEGFIQVPPLLHHPW